ncbi:MAG: hypothetical protein K2X91_04675, partial [Thermoleophilia bacterium]|nr:hypothetical protein [Thermoleophilia bacterium]
SRYPLAMASTAADRTRLLDALIELGRAERAGGPDALARARASIEGVVGPTVSPALAARLLGVGRTALDRHVAEGAVPSVITPAGRREIPLPELLDLVFELEETRREGRWRRPLARTLRMRRERARWVDDAAVTLVAGAEGDPGLAYHRAVALRLDPRTVRDAQLRLERWRRAGNIDERWAREWERVLAMPLDRIATLITAEGPEGRDLRQSSPFAGALGHEERRRLLERAQPAS